MRTYYDINLTDRTIAKRDFQGEENVKAGRYFIAKTLLERAGATLSLENRPAPERGATVRLHWSRSDFERPLTFATA